MGIFDECENELRSAANELREMKDCILRDFSGINQELCADFIELIAASYDRSSNSSSN